MLRRAFGKSVLALRGWKIAGALPEREKYVLIAAPHTSNWDLVYMLCIAFVLDMKINWMGKDSLFKPPLGFLLSWLGGVAIDRSKTNNVVQAMADEFTTRDRLILAVPPSGTRGRKDHWKSGFYHIAKVAQVPIVMGYLDYATKTGGFGPNHLIPGGDLSADMDAIREFYGTISGKFPDKVSPARLRDEGPKATPVDEPAAG
jgi:1-acyl-sn-glycerol-3-phosphate acyltransferase